MVAATCSNVSSSISNTHRPSMLKCTRPRAGSEMATNSRTSLCSDVLFDASENGCARGETLTSSGIQSIEALHDPVAIVRRTRNVALSTLLAGSCGVTDMHPGLVPLPQK